MRLKIDAYDDENYADLTSTHMAVCWVPEHVSVLFEQPMVGAENPLGVSNLSVILCRALCWALCSQYATCIDVFLSDAVVGWHGNKDSVYMYLTHLS